MKDKKCDSREYSNNKKRRSQRETGTRTFESKRHLFTWTIVYAWDCFFGDGAFYSFVIEKCSVFSERFAYFRDGMCDCDYVGDSMICSFLARKEMESE